MKLIKLWPELNPQTMCLSHYFRLVGQIPEVLGKGKSNFRVSLEACKAIVALMFYMSGRINDKTRIPCLHPGCHHDIPAQLLIWHLTSMALLPVCPIQHICFQGIVCLIPYLSWSKLSASCGPRGRCPTLAPLIHNVQMIGLLQHGKVGGGITVDSITKPYREAIRKRDHEFCIFLGGLVEGDAVLLHNYG